MRYVFIHGAGCTRSVFDPQARAFPDALVPALPGHGCPGEPASVAAFAQALAGPIAALGEPVVLCGSSMGGAIALELALARTPGVRGVVTIGSGARLRVAPALLEGLEADFAAAARSLAPHFFAEPRPEWVAGAVAAMELVGAAQTLRDFRACDAWDARERLGDLAVPLLALVGERDALTPPKVSQALADRVPRGETRILPDAGHLAAIEAPAAINAALRAFLERLPT